MGTDSAIERPHAWRLMLRKNLQPSMRQNWRPLDAARPEAVAKQHALGKLTSRERLDLLVDPGTFFEYGIPPKKRGVIP